MHLFYNVVTKKEASEKCRQKQTVNFRQVISYDVNVVQNSCITLRQSNCTKKIARCVSKLFHSALVPIDNNDVQGASCLHTCLQPDHCNNQVSS